MMSEILISRVVSIILLATLLLTGVQPVQGESFTSSFYESSSDATDSYRAAQTPDQMGTAFALDDIGTISGTIYEADGNTPIENIYVSASGDPNYFTSDCTDASGQFTLSGLPLDVPLNVQASPPWANCGEWSNYVQEFWQDTKDPNSASLITLSTENPDRPDINFTLDAGGVISGMVHAADGITPLQHIAVSFQNGGNSYGNSVCSDASGYYEFHGVPFDMPLIVSTYAYHDNWCNAGGNYISEYWQESPDLISATLVAVTSLSPLQDNIDFTLDSAGSISGTAYEADGVTPIPDIPVKIFGNNYWGESPVTDSLGNYTIYNVPFGLSVYLYAGDASLCVGENSHAVEFWPEASNLNTASLVDVSAQTPNLTGADFTLDPVPCASSDPWMRAWYMDDTIEADDWPVGTHLTVEIEDMTTPISPDYSVETDITDSMTWLNLKGLFDIKPGMFVVLSGASMSRVVKVNNLTITNIDQDLDTITGTTSPDYWLWMWINDPACCRSAESDGSGIWIFDYSVPGPNGELPIDIRPGSEGAVHAPSGDGSTSVEWRIPSKTLHVVPAHPEIHGHDWPSGANVTLTVDDDTNAGNGVLYTESKNADGEPLWCGYPCFDLNGLFPLEVGQYVTLADGENTKTVHISPLTIRHVDPDKDMVSGIADPGSRVAVNIWSQNGIARYVTTAGDGTWVADFSVAGDEDFEQELADIQLGDNGRAIQLNPDGTDDGTLEYWDVSFPIATSSARASTSPTAAASINFTVTFSESVTGVTTDDFALHTTGVIGATITGVSGSVTNYTVTVNTGSGNGTIRLDVVDDNSIVDATSNPLGGGNVGDGDFTSGQIYTIIKDSSFSDLNNSYWAWQYIERLYNTGITSGCTTSPLNYCPEASVTRAQMAIFLEKGKAYPSSYSPPNVTPTFTDTVGHWAEDWIEVLKTDGITSGCGIGLYCPEAPVTRAQMAVFLLKAKYGSTYNPPAVGTSTGFGDVPTAHWAAAWIKQLVAEGVTSGCGSGNYCPDAPVTRAQMAVFLVRTFGLP